MVIIGGIALVRQLSRLSGQSEFRAELPTPEQLLAERFARGEVDEQEYHRRLDTLRTAQTRKVSP